MGDVTEMMEEGLLCQVCGVYIESPTGIWTTCASCSEE